VIRGTQAAFEAELRDLDASLEERKLQIQEEYEQRVQAFGEQWSRHLRSWQASASKGPSRLDYLCTSVHLTEGRTEESVLEEQAGMAPARDRNLQVAEQRYQAGVQECWQRQQQDMAPLVQQITSVRQRAAGAGCRAVPAARRFNLWGKDMRGRQAGKKDTYIWSGSARCMLCRQ
jgi:hypothetical protein